VKPAHPGRAFHAMTRLAMRWPDSRKFELSRTGPRDLCVHGCSARALGSLPTAQGVKRLPKNRNADAFLEKLVIENRSMTYAIFDVAALGVPAGADGQ